MKRLPLLVAWLLVALLLAPSGCLSPALFAQTFLSENFNAGIPASWTVQNGGTTADTWFSTTGGFTGQYLNSTEFAFVNSDAAGTSTSICLDEILRTPVVNTAGVPVLMLEFDQYFRHSGQTDSGFVEVFDGLQWQTAAAFSSSMGNFGNPNHQVINLSAYANANLQLRFRYDDNCTWAWYWALDNVLLFTPLTLDASVAAITSPSGNGRQLTSSALSATETISLQIGNPGLDTLVNVPVWYRVNNGAPTGPEIVPGPIPPLGNVPFSFSATANLSATGGYLLECWTGLANDANTANDTALISLRQIANPPRPLPYCQNFDAAPDTVAASNFVGAMPGLPELDFFTSGGPGGRLRTAAGNGFYQSGNRAITLDKSPTGSPNSINDVWLTYNLAAYNAATDVVLLDFSLMDHGDEVSANDSVWVRGSDTSAWIGVSGWNTLSSGNNGIYYTLAGTNVSGLLTAKGQNFSSSFQIRLGQEDNFDAASTISSDGVTFDDVCLSLEVNVNCGVTAILEPVSQSCGDSIQPIRLSIENFGLDTLANVPVEITVSGAASFSVQDTLPGPLLPGQVGSLFLYAGGFTGGNFQVCAYTQLPGDSVYADDTTCISLSLIAPQTALVIPDTLCSGDSTVLRVVQPNPLYRYTWWDSLAGGNLLSTADSLVVPPLSSDSTWFVEAHTGFRGQLGPPNNSFGTGGNYTLYQDGLVFDVLQPVTIDTVYIYTAGPGMVKVNVLDASNVLLSTASATVAGVGRKAIPVGITVYPGTSYRMNATGSTVTGLYRNDTSAAFPYLLQNAVSITNTISGNGSLGFYYFFYDWRVTVPGCPGPRSPVTVRVLNAPPSAGFSLAASQTVVSFADTSTGTVQNWVWDFGDGNTSSLASPVHAYLAPGSYQACLMVSNACGSDTTCDSLTVCESLNPGFWSFGTGTMVTFNDTSTGAATWHWTFGDGGVDSTASASHNYAAEGNYLACLTVTNACLQSDSVCDTVAACSILGAAFSFQQLPGNGLDYAFTDQSSGVPTSYFWDFGDGTTSTQQSPNHVFLQTGPLSVSLTVTNACGQSETSVQSITVVGLEDAAFAGMAVAPNPGLDIFRVFLPDLAPERLEMRVLDLHGRVVWSGEWDAGQWPADFRVNLGGVAAGIYLLEVRYAGNRALRRLNKL